MLFSIKKFKPAMLAGLSLLTLQSLSAVKPALAVDLPVETKQQHDQRMQWWREAKFGMFIHWGLYAVPAGTWNGQQIGGIGEWIMNYAKIPTKDYQAFAKQFNPVNFNADEWVKTAKAAGMKYIVITAKHHDGFCMYHTGVDNFNIYDGTPYHHDPIADLAAACKKNGIKFGVYYSQCQDWNHPGGGIYGTQWDPAQKGDYDSYLKNVASPQVKELLTQYQPAVLWFDTPVDMNEERASLFTSLFALDPKIIVNNRLGGTSYHSDTETPEQFIPATGYPGRDWETCMTINDTWGYKSSDHNFKSTETLLHNLVDIASKGGNYLLNVGPDPTGIIPQPEIDRLKEIGAWTGKYGESLYGISASPFRRLPFDGRCTRKGNTLYLHVFTWPADGLKLIRLETPVKSVSMLGSSEKLTAKKSVDGDLIISRPKVLNPLDTVIKLQLAGELKIASYIGHADENGAYTLNAEDAVLSGNNIRLENDPVNIGYWTDNNDSVSWKVDLKGAAQAYQVELSYACPPEEAGSEIAVQTGMGDNKVRFIVASTEKWESYKTVRPSGTINLAPGINTITIAVEKKPKNCVMNLRKIRFIPVQ